MSYWLSGLRIKVYFLLLVLADYIGPRPLARRRPRGGTGNCSSCYGITGMFQGSGWRSAHRAGCLGGPGGGPG